MTNNMKTEEIKKSLSLLAPASLTARNLMLQKTVCIKEFISEDVNTWGKLFTFHPNGNSGCLEMNDDYFLGIRCDHLMWCEGRCEHTDEILNTWDNADDVLIIYGNHKGLFVGKVIF